MSVEKSVHLAATGSTIERAVAQALDRATIGPEGVTRFKIEEIEGRFEAGVPEFRACLVHAARAAAWVITRSDGAGDGPRRVPDDVALNLHGLGSVTAA